MTTRTEDGRTYKQTWNAHNKLQSVTWIAEGTPCNAEFVYGGDGNRLLKLDHMLNQFDPSTPVEMVTVYVGAIYEQQGIILHTYHNRTTRHRPWLRTSALVLLFTLVTTTTVRARDVIESVTTISQQSLLERMPHDYRTVGSILKFQSSVRAAAG